MAIDHLAPSLRRGGSLPAQPSLLVGRARRCGGSANGLRSDDTRLLTLLGPAGTGKTRLAIEVAGEAADAFPDGVFFVDLSATRPCWRLPSRKSSTCAPSPSGSSWRR